MNLIAKLIFRYPHVYLGVLLLAIFTPFTSSSVLTIDFLIKYIFFSGSFFLLLFFYYLFLVSFFLHHKHFTDNLWQQKKVRSSIKQIYLNQSALFCLFPLLSLWVESVFAKLFFLILLMFVFLITTALKLSKKLHFSAITLLVINFLGFGAINSIGFFTAFNFLMLLV